MYSLVNFLPIEKSPTKIKTYLCLDHVIKIHLPMCGRMSSDSSGDCTHTNSLRILCCKGEALELFSVGRQLISSQNGD
jgi:DNA-directed RNA polymerase V subunit 1